MTEADWRAGVDPAPLLRFAEPRLTDRLRLLFMAACCRRVWDLLRDARFRRLVEAAEDRAEGRATEEELQAAAGEVPVSDWVPISRFIPAWLRHAHYAVLAVGRRDILAVAEQSEMAAAQFADELIAEQHPRNDEIRLLRDEVRRMHERTAECRDRGNAAEEAADAAYDREREVDEQIERIGCEIWSDGAAERIERAREERAAQAAIVRCLIGNPFRPPAVEPAWLTSTVLALVRGIEADRAFDRLPILADALQEAGCDRDDFLTHARDDRAHARGCWVVESLLGRSPRHNLHSA